MIEAPLTTDAMGYTPVGQIGESLLSFTRTLAISPDQNTIFVSTISGVTVLPVNFDHAAAAARDHQRVQRGGFGTSAPASGGSIDINGVGSRDQFRRSRRISTADDARTKRASP